MVPFRNAALAMLAVAGGVCLADHAVAGPKYLTPLTDAPSAATARVSDRELTDVERLGGTSIEGTNLVVAGAKGSLGVGLLLGPIGVAANIAKINAENKARGQSVTALTQADVIQLMKDVRQGEAVEGERAYELLPVIYINFQNDKTFRVSCLLNAMLPNGKRPWHGRYSVEMPGTYDVEAADAATEAFVPCLTEANRLFEGHAGGGMKPGDTKHPVVINGKTVQMTVVASELPARTIVPNVLGLFEYPVPAAQ